MLISARAPAATSYTNCDKIGLLLRVNDGTQWAEAREIAERKLVDVRDAHPLSSNPFLTKPAASTRNTFPCAPGVEAPFPAP